MSQNPLCKASAMPGTPAWTMGVFPADQVPVGTDLYAMPPVSRLKLELECAMENGQKWKEHMHEYAAENKKLRARIRDLEAEAAKVVPMSIVDQMPRDNLYYWWLPKFDLERKNEPEAWSLRYFSEDALTTRLGLFYGPATLPTIPATTE